MATESARLPWGAPNSTSSGSVKLPLHVRAGSHLESTAITQIGPLINHGAGYERTATTTAVLSATGSRTGHTASIARSDSKASRPRSRRSHKGPLIRTVDRLARKVWPCPGTGPRVTAGEAYAHETATIEDSIRLPVGTYDSKWELSLSVWAHANDDAALSGFEWQWTLTTGTGQITVHYTTAVPGTAPVPGTVTQFGDADPLLQGSVTQAADDWAYAEATAWAESAFEEWNTRHGCSELKPSRATPDVPPNIPVIEKIKALRTKLGEVIDQFITASAPPGVSVSPKSARATASQPAVFKLTSDSANALTSKSANGLRRAFRRANEVDDDVDFVGVSDDGRSVLDVPVDTAPPTVTVYSYAESQNATGSDAAFNGQGSLSVGMASQSPYSDQNDELKCQPADETPLYDAAATDNLADSTGAAYACSGALWIGDQTWNVSGSGTYVEPDGDPNDPSSHCSDSYSGQFPLTGTSTPEMVYLLYDADGNLTSAFLDALPGGFAGDIDYTPSVPGSFGSVNLGFPAIRDQETCYGVAAHPYPATDLPFTLKDVSSGKQLTASLAKAGSESASGTPDGGPATVNFNFSLKAVFKIDNAGSPAGS